MRLPLTVLILATQLPLSLGAQLRDVTDEFTEPGRLKGQAGLHLDYGSPQGEFARNIDRGFGVSGWVGVGLDRDSRVLLGVEGGFLSYQTPSRLRAPGSGSGDDASNSIITLGIPLRIEFTDGPVRPYATGSVGGSYFTTFTVEFDDSEEDDLAVNTIYSDLTLNWTAGIGMVFQLRGGRAPLFLDLGVRQVANGVVNYLNERSLDDASVIHPIRSEANLTIFQMGVAVGLR